MAIRMGNTARSGASGVLRDVARGLFLGEYATDIGMPGTIAQAAIGFTPVAGTLAAARDTAASWQRRDWPGVALNGVAMMPAVGGFAKIVEAARVARRIQRVLKRRR